MWLKCVLHLEVLHPSRNLFLQSLIAMILAPIEHVSVLLKLLLLLTVYFWCRYHRLSLPAHGFYPTSTSSRATQVIVWNHWVIFRLGTAFCGIGWFLWMHRPPLHEIGRVVVHAAGELGVRICPLWPDVPLEVWLFISLRIWVKALHFPGIVKRRTLEMTWLWIGGASRFIVRPIKVFDITHETLGLGPILVWHNGLGVKGVAEGHLIHRDRRLVELD